MTSIKEKSIVTLKGYKGFDKRSLKNTNKEKEKQMRKEKKEVVEAVVVTTSSVTLEEVTNEITQLKSMFNVTDMAVSATLFKVVQLNATDIKAVKQLIKETFSVSWAKKLNGAIGILVGVNHTDLTDAQKLVVANNVPFEKLYNALRALKKGTLGADGAIPVATNGAAHTAQTIKVKKDAVAGNAALMAIENSKVTEEEAKAYMLDVRGLMTNMLNNGKFKELYTICQMVDDMAYSMLEVSTVNLKTA